MSSAVISECGQYRYSLSRSTDMAWGGKGDVLFVMLNPSTADASIDDPTIRRCQGFANRWDHSGFKVVNLYALRSTNPKELWKHSDPVGVDNDAMIETMLHNHDYVVCAWGNNAKKDRVAAFYELVKKVHGQKLWCLGINDNGSPKHPLYVKKDQKLVEWNYSRYRDHGKNMIMNAELWDAIR